MTVKKIATAAVFAGSFSIGLAHAEQVVPEHINPEPGYVISEQTLLFPSGGSHMAEPEALREAYGLIGSDDALIRTKFADQTGNIYQVGFRIEGSTLFFLEEEIEEIENTSNEAAENILRETYGLIGDLDALIRTRW